MEQGGCVRSRACGGTRSPPAVRAEQDTHRSSSKPAEQRCSFLAAKLVHPPVLAHSHCTVKNCRGCGKHGTGMKHMLHTASTQQHASSVLRHPSMPPQHLRQCKHGWPDAMTANADPPALGCSRQTAGCPPQARQTNTATEHDRIEGRCDTTYEGRWEAFWPGAASEVSVCAR